MKPLSELHLLSRTIYVTNVNMALTLAEFLLFLQNKGKCIERYGKNVKIITSTGMLRAAARQTELVGSVRDCC